MSYTMGKDLITLRQFMQYLDPESSEEIQIAYEEWDTFDSFWVGSKLLEPFLDYKIKCLGAIAPDIFRVLIEINT